MIFFNFIHSNNFILLILSIPCLKPVKLLVYCILGYILPSSRKWLARHINDPFVKKAQKLGLRSRAAFKLIEIQEKYSFIKPGDSVLDLGSAPGSWSEACAKWIKQGKIVACDLLYMDDIQNVNFIQGDFTEQDTQQQILATANNEISVIISDMSPNKTGMKKVDQWKSAALAETLLNFANNNLKENGNMLFKTFHGDGFEEILKTARSMFVTVKSIKPEASRKNSTEIFLLCLAMKNNS